MSMAKMLIIACLVFSAFNAQDNGQGITVLNESESVIYNGSALIRVDDELLEFRIGNTVIPFTPRVDYTYVHSFNQLKISPTDVITIRGRNFSEVFNSNNPASILALITFDIGGTKYTITTNRLTWRCDGDNAMNVANNDGSAYYPIVSQIATTAHNIWAYNYNREVTCVYDPNNLPPVDNSSFVGNAYVNVDNELLEFKIGGKPISFKNVGGDHTYVHFFPQIKIKATDPISITVKNWEPWNWNWNPGSIMATIRYTNNLGQLITINTSQEWNCMGLGPILMLNNVSNRWWRQISGIELMAYHIWNPTLSQVCTCTYDPLRKINARLTARVDDEFLEFWVNGEKKDFVRQGNNWTANYVIDFYYETGWPITIVGKNQNSGFSRWNPASIVATINYTDKDGSSKRINTDTIRWRCNNNVPMHLGINVQSSWWFQVSNVDVWAVNIWPSDSSQIATCTYN